MTAPPGISARFRGTLGKFALDVAFTAPARGVTALFGPSGCGKTTVLRCVAGLQHLADGHLSVGGEVWQDGPRARPPHRRAIGYVFQEASLFPHLTVRENLLYGQSRAAKDGAARAVRTDETVALLGLERLLDRSPRHLSGGERQRVAIGRALLAQPSVLLMDEPLSALDRFSKNEILPYLETLHDALAIPVLYVSHDIAEVERLADHMVLLRDGQVLAAGRIEDLQADPSLPLARMPDAGVILHTTVRGYDPVYGLTTLAFPGGELVLPGHLGQPGTPRRARIVASDVSLARRRVPESSILNSLPARIVATDIQDGAVMVNVVLRLGEDGTSERLLARITRRSWDTLRFEVGDLVFAQVKSIALLYRDVVAADERART
jgi:molybdate transport system ATP-binding protein